MRAIITVVAFGLIAQLCNGAVVEIPADNATIRQGVSAASVSDRVLVSPGLYDGDVYIGKALTLFASHELTAEINGDDCCDPVVGTELSRGGSS